MTLSLMRRRSIDGLLGADAVVVVGFGYRYRSILTIVHPPPPPMMMMAILTTSSPPRRHSILGGGMMEEAVGVRER